VAEPAIVTPLFTDLVGSTDLLSALGEQRAEQVRRVHFGILREAIAARAGEEVKSLGDALMVAVASPAEAVSCAIAMQQRVWAHNRRAAAPELQVRIGLDVGEPMRAEHDYFGTPVVVARRLCDRAEGGPDPGFGTDQLVAARDPLDGVLAVVGDKLEVEAADLPACRAGARRRPGDRLHRPAKPK